MVKQYVQTVQRRNQEQQPEVLNQPPRTELSARPSASHSCLHTKICHYQRLQTGPHRTSTLSTRLHSHHSLPVGLTTLHGDRQPLCTEEPAVPWGHPHRCCPPPPPRACTSHPPGSNSVPVFLLPPFLPLTSLHLLGWPVTMIKPHCPPLYVHLCCRKWIREKHLLSPSILNTTSRGPLLQTPSGHACSPTASLSHSLPAQLPLTFCLSSSQDLTHSFLLSPRKHWQLEENLHRPQSHLPSYLCLCPRVLPFLTTGETYPNASQQAVPPTAQ